MPATRRLAAILAADVAGYSRLIGTDERGTLEQLRAIRNELIDPTIAAHNGRIVKRTGDGFLVEFASTVDALTCAEKIQAQMAERNLTSAPESRIDYRMGIHQGDIVVEEDGDIFGDGLNIAARLEGLAEPGGICVSARVQEDAAGKLDLAFRDIGEQQLKNIARPVRAYSIKATTVPREGTAATPVPRLSVVVLPFANLNNDPEQQYFADGITEDLTTDLSRIAGSFVISRNTAFTFKNKHVETKQIGRELGVRYVLEGSVRRSGSQVRITAQLIDAETDAHLWAERFDRAIGDLFSLQDEITSRIAVTLSLELVRVEATRPTQHPGAMDFILRGRAAVIKPRSHDSFTERIDFFERALALDPHSVEAQSRLALSLTARVMDDMSDTSAADLGRAGDLVGQALAASPYSPIAHYAKGNLLRARRRFVEAVPEYEAVLAFDRNWVNALFALGQCKAMTGLMEETIPLMERAILLSPRDPILGSFFSEIGRVHLLQSRTDEAILWLEKARNATPAHPSFRAWLASAYALTGDTDSAAVELGEAQRLSSSNRFSSIASTKAWYSVTPTIAGLLEDIFLAGLRKAGMPEE
jgi:TolB-like protein